jgi:hypothetical protein
MQPLVAQDVNVEVRVSAGRKRCAQATGDAPAKAKPVKPVDYTIVQDRTDNSPVYRKLASARLDLDFPMFYKTE